MSHPSYTTAAPLPDTANGEEAAIQARSTRIHAKITPIKRNCTFAVVNGPKVTGICVMEFHAVCWNVRFAPPQILDFQYQLAKTADIPKSPGRKEGANAPTSLRVRSTGVCACVSCSPLCLCSVHVLCSSKAYPLSRFFTLIIVHDDPQRLPTRPDRPNHANRHPHDRSKHIHSKPSIPTTLPLANDHTRPIPAPIQHEHTQRGAIQPYAIPHRTAMPQKRRVALSWCGIRDFEQFWEKWKEEKMCLSHRHLIRGAPELSHWTLIKRPVCSLASLAVFLPAHPAYRELPDSLPWCPRIVLCFFAKSDFSIAVSTPQWLLPFFHFSIAVLFSPNPPFPCLLSLFPASLLKYLS